MPAAKFFIDVEFYVKKGIPVEIIPISIGIASDYAGFRAEFKGARKAAEKTVWLRENVLPHLVGPELSVPVIAEKIKDFVGRGPVEFVASYGAYDWVIFCQIFGGLLEIPESWPSVFTEASVLDLPRVERVGGKHDALADAETLRRAYRKKYPLELTQEERALIDPCDCPFHKGMPGAPSGANCGYTGLGR